MNPDDTIVRLATGITGMDELIEGGVPDGSVNLITGPAGAGKTLFGLQFLINGAQNGQKGLYITLEENSDSLRKSMKRYGIDLAALEEQEMLYLMDLTSLRSTANIQEEKDLGLLRFNSLWSTMENHIKWSGVKRVCIDSLTAVGLMYKDLEELRSELFRFSRHLRDCDVTSILFTESLESGPLTRFGMEQFVSDSFIVLGLERIQGELRRTITIRKMRHTKHDVSIHPFLIMNNGIVVASDEKVV